MKTELQQGEKIVKDGSANLQKNIETVGGKLFLTNQRLVFEADKTNVQRGTTEVELSSIQSLRTRWTRFPRVHSFVSKFAGCLHEARQRIPVCLI